MKIEDKKASEFASTVMHSFIIYLLLTSSGIALFAPSCKVLQTSIPIAVVFLIGSLLGIAEWSERKIVKKSLSEELISVLVSFLSVYLTIVGVGISLMIEFGLISRISWELLSVFIFAAAFLVYSLSDLPQLLERSQK